MLDHLPDMNKKQSYKELEQQVKDLQKQIRMFQQSESVPPSTDIPGGTLLYSLIQSLPLIYMQNPPQVTSHLQTTIIVKV